MFSRRTPLAACLFALAAAATPGRAEPVPPGLYANLQWRMIGPFRGGRTVGAAGVPGRPNVFYIGVNNGGVWKTTDAGRVWAPIFDDQPTGSVGALAVAPSDPDVLYVGSGEGLQRPDLSTGDGVYKSADGGKTWKNMGLGDGQQISAILIDPNDPDRVFVAVLGHPYGANEERGVFRTTDGGKTWKKVLYKDENTGAVALAFDPRDPRTVYADLWAARQGPWENGRWHGEGSGLFKSADGGDTWKQLTKGLPTVKDGLGRIGFAVAPGDPKRMYATVDAPKLGGIYRSDDAGDSWERVNDEARLWGRGDDFAEVKVDPKDKDIVYVANTSTYRSADGGKTFTAFKGAPGGDDYHTVWINPDNSDVILLAGDQGATVTVNGGKTWSSWYNQPTAQFYHVSTDDQFPCRVYGGQQESGSAGVSSRGDDGQITFRDWRPVGAEEYGYVAPDPLHPNLIYGGKATRYDRTTGQAQDVSPEALRSGKYRFLRTAPLLFSPVDPHVLYLGANVLFKTTNGGDGWEVISPDLSRERPDVPESVGVYRTPEMAKQPRRGVIYTVAPSYKDGDVIWAGTDDGLIHVTRDGGKTWKDVTPPGVDGWSKVSLMDAGRFDAETAYAAVNRIRLDDQRPHVYRTHDGGKTWKEVVRGLPDAPVNAVREDPVRKGLLFAGTERAVFVSFNDGDDWQPLRLNMPATSVRDLVVHDDDLVVATHGRSFWILDDITPLRQLDDKVVAADAHLFRPQTALRVRWNLNTDTPLPPDEPAGKNPPDGAVIDYYLKETAKGPATLEVLDGDNKLVRRFSSDDKPAPVNEKDLDIPAYWVRPAPVLSAAAGAHRFVWDLHYPPPEGVGRSYPLAAVIHDTPAEPRGPWVLPGEYTVRLTVGGESYTQPLTVKMDPRVMTAPEQLERQFALSMRCCKAIRQAQGALREVGSLRSELKESREKTKEEAALKEIDALDEKAAALEGVGRSRRERRLGGPGAPSFSRVTEEAARLLDILQGADAAPTAQAEEACAEMQDALAKLVVQWERLKAERQPPGFLGYTELRTDLPGGRHANVVTMRAVVVRADGTDRRVLAEDLTKEPNSWTQFAGWSPDGSVAVVGRGWESAENGRWEEEHKTFRYTADGWLCDAYLLDLADGKATNLTAVDRVSFHNSGLFFWPNDPTKLGFQALIDGNSHPFQMDRDGKNKRDLTKDSKEFAYGFGASPDGRRIAYHKNYQVYVADADGSNAKQIETKQPFNFCPTWSPDGEWLLFLSGEHYDCHPHVVRADGTCLKKLAGRGGYKGVVEFLDAPDFHGGSSDVPAWAADGKSVFYTAAVGRNVELFRVTLDGKTEQLTDAPAGSLHYHPRPSPDGKWLAYGSRRDGVRQLFVMRLADGKERRVTDLKEGHAAMWPYWQPDGQGP
jgi:Tol biopolymer transport system component/photosystem II stability/assembly factor-like uncharacterized protein